MSGSPDRKICFVIAPIGEEGSDTRKRSDQVLQYIIEPAITEFGYVAIRADRISDPGVINSQVIQHILTDDLAVADMTESNPNVFYELAIRHAFGKPVILIVEADQTIPFDVRGMRAIQVDHHDLDSVAQCKEEIANQIRAINSNVKIHTPITETINLQQLQQSGDPLDTGIADIKVAVGNLAADLSVLQTQLRTVAQASDLPRISSFSGSGSGTVNHGLGTRPDLIILQSADGSPLTYDSVGDTTVHIESPEGPTTFTGIAIAVMPYAQVNRRSAISASVTAAEFAERREAPRRAERAVQNWLPTQYPGCTVEQHGLGYPDFVVTRPDGSKLGIQVRFFTNQSALRRIVADSYFYVESKWRQEYSVFLVSAGAAMAAFFQDEITRLDLHKPLVTFFVGYLDDSGAFQLVP